MNNRGQGLSLILVTFITVLVGLVLMVPVAQQVGSTTNLDSVTNLTHTAAANGVNSTLSTYQNIVDVVVYNASSGEIIGAGNYTVYNDQVVNGNLAVLIQTDSTQYQSYDWNLTFTGQPVGYIKSSGTRSIASLIIIFFALMVMAVAMSPVMKGEFMKLIGK